MNLFLIDWGISYIFNSFMCDKTANEAHEVLYCKSDYNYFRLTRQVCSGKKKFCNRFRTLFCEQKFIINMLWIQKIQRTPLYLITILLLLAGVNIRYKSTDLFRKFFKEKDSSLLILGMPKCWAENALQLHFLRSVTLEWHTKWACFSTGINAYNAFATHSQLAVLY